MTSSAKLRSLLRITQHNYELEISSWAKDVAIAYVRAVKGLEAMIYMIPATIQTTIIQERIILESVHEVTGQVAHPKPNDPSITEIMRVAERKFLNSQRHDLSSNSETYEDAVGRWEQLEDAPQVAGGLQAFLSAIVTTSWTTFEILAGDLWVKALDHHPHVLSDLSGKRYRITDRAIGKASRVGGDASGSSAEKVVPLSQVQMYGYDLSAHMGSILRQSQSFDKLDGIRSAYSLAFSSDHDAIDMILAGEEIDSLSILRNLLVHRGGKIDEKYIKRAHRFKLCPVGNADEHVQLDGEIVANIVIPTIFAGYHIIEAVSGWIASNSSRYDLES